MSCVTKQDEKVEDLSFFEYSAKHWLAHYSEVDMVRKDTDGVLFDLSCKFFNLVKSPNFMSGLEEYWR
jgi:hypothetical protein